MLGDAEVHRVVLWYQTNNAFLTAIQMFDFSDKKLVDFGWSEGSRKGTSGSSKEYLLEKGERICGVKARQGTDACHHDLQLVIGRME